MIDSWAPPPDPPPPDPRRDVGDARPLLVPRLIASCRVVVHGGFVLMALLGALVTPPIGMLLVAPLTGAAAFIVVAMLNPAFPAEPWARRGALLAGATGAAFVPFANGVALSGNAGGVVALVLLILGSCVAADWLMDVLERSPGSGVARDDRWMQVVLPSLPTPELLREWRAAQRAFGSLPADADRARVVKLRGLLLEEFARRDPAAVERWLTGGDWSAEPNIRADGDAVG